MDSAQIFVTAGGALLILLNLCFFFGAREEKSSPKTDESANRYACPMHPWITSSDPTANCSICGMKLVERD